MRAFAVLTVALVATSLCALGGCKRTPEPLILEKPGVADAPQTPPVPGPRRAHDVHAHLSPLSYPVATQFMDESGLQRVVNMSGGNGREYILQNLAAADQAGQRIALFYNLDWSGIDEPGFGQERAQEFTWAIAQGYGGLKISKALGLGVKTADGKLLAVDDERLDPIWQTAGKHGVVVGIHTSDPKAFFEKPGPQNERHKELSHAPSWSFYGPDFPSRNELLAARDRMIARNPGTTFLLLHFANNPEDIEYVDALLKKHPNLVIDVAARLGEFGRHEASRVRKFFVDHQDRILFATDIMLTVQPYKGQMAYSLTLGSISEKRPTLDDIKPFYDLHWKYFESSEAAIDHPVPIQGDWQVHPLALEADVLDKLYFKNAERIIFAPWLARRAASTVGQTAQQLAAASSDGSKAAVVEAGAN
ncbi:MAG: amidohydrolase family protein [Bradymonadaceae bacterium]|nr:amidohydrolase family protein [Lujinxingiaceae bacterium]